MIATLALFGILIVDSVGSVSSGGELTKDAYVSESAGLETGQYVSVTKVVGTGTNETVVNSRGNSLEFSGNPDSTLSGSTGISLSNKQNWTLHQGLWMNASQTGQNMTVVAVGDPDVVLRYVGNVSSPYYEAVYYTTSDSHAAQVDAVSPENGTQLFVVRDGGTMTIYRNSTAGQSVGVNSDSTYEGNLTADGNYGGRLDETRVWSSSLNTTQRDTLLSNAVSPLPGSNPTLRILYDAGTGDSVRFWFAGGSGTATNVAWADGFDGQEMDRVGLLPGGDYRWQSNGPQIKAVEGGRLDGAPVAYVDFDYQGVSANVINGFSESMNLLPVVFVVLVAGMILSVVQRFKQ